MLFTDKDPSVSPHLSGFRLSGYWHALLLFLAIVPFFLKLGGSSLWDSNEAFYAETPREMLETGDFIIPRFNYYFRWHKPPLTYWAVALSYRLFGVSEASQRLPIALAAAAWVLLCYGIGRAWVNRNTGLLAALILATNFRVFIMSRRAITEIWLAFWVSLALTLIAMVLVRKPRSAPTLLAAAYAALGVAVLIKGPVAAVLVGGTVLVFMLWRRSWQDFLLLRPWMGLIILAAILLPWYWNVVSLVGWQPVKTFLLSDNFGRYLTEDFGPQRGLWYYPAVLFADFFPWLLLALGGALALGKKLVPEDPDLKSLGAWLFAWVGWGLLFFSISRNKQEYYILPLYLPLALLLAHLLMNRAAARNWDRIRVVVFILEGVVAAAGAWFLVIPARLLLPGWPLLQAAGAAAVLLLLAVGLGVAALKRCWGACLALSSGLLWSGLILMAWLILPHWEYYKPVRQFAAIIQAQRQPGDYCGYYKYSAPSLAFYLREPIFEMIWEDQALHLLSKSSRRIFCIIGQEDFETIAPRLQQQYRIVASRELLSFRARDLLQWDAPRQNPRLLLISNAP